MENAGRDIQAATDTLDVAPDQSSGPEPLLTLAQAADRLDLHPAALRRAIAQRALLPERYTPGGQPRFSPAAVEAYAEERARAHATLSPELRSRFARVVDAPQHADLEMRQTLREVRAADPAFPLLAIFERMPPGRTSFPLRLLTSEGFPQALTERLDMILTGAGGHTPSDFYFPRIFASGEPLFFADTNRRPARQPGSAMLQRFAGVRATAALPLIRGGEVGGLLALAGPAPYRFTARGKDLLREVADELTLLLTATQQLTRRERWLEAIMAFVSAVRDQSPAGAAGAATGEAQRAREAAALEALGRAFLRAYGAEEVFIEGLGVDLPPTSPALRALATRTSPDEPLHVAAWSDTRGALTGVALGAALGATEVRLGALWRDLLPHRVTESEAALYELAGVCASVAGFWR